MIQMKIMYKYRNKLTGGWNNYALIKVRIKWEKGEGNNGTNNAFNLVYQRVGVGNCRPFC
jgi:hypothetical protein